MLQLVTLELDFKEKKAVSSSIRLCIIACCSDVINAKVRPLPI